MKAATHGYDSFLRPLLPRRTVSYNGVSVRAGRLGDSVVPWQSTRVPGYEHAIVRGIRRHVREADTVVVVGGGWGVSTVAAARAAGDDGTVITYEGARNSVENIRETVRLNGVDSGVTVRHAVVAENNFLRGDEGGATTLSPTELPESDVLVLDCEGAERAILDEMVIEPRVLIVETHGVHGAPFDAVSELLGDAGYTVIGSEVAEERFRELCIERGIYVITSTLRDERNGDSTEAMIP